MVDIGEPRISCLSTKSKIKFKPFRPWIIFIKITHHIPNVLISRIWYLLIAIVKQEFPMTLTLV